MVFPSCHHAHVQSLISNTNSRRRAVSHSLRGSDPTKSASKTPQMAPAQCSCDQCWTTVKLSTQHLTAKNMDHCAVTIAPTPDPNVIQDGNFLGFRQNENPGMAKTAKHHCKTSDGHTGTTAIPSLGPVSGTYPQHTVSDDGQRGPRKEGQTQVRIYTSLPLSRFTEGKKSIGNSTEPGTPFTP